MHWNSTYHVKEYAPNSDAIKHIILCDVSNTVIYQLLFEELTKKLSSPPTKVKVPKATSTSLSHKGHCQRQYRYYHMMLATFYAIIDL